MKRILDQNAIAEWEYYVPQIIKQAKMEKNSGIHIDRGRL